MLAHLSSLIIQSEQCRAVWTEQCERYSVITHSDISLLPPVKCIYATEVAGWISVIYCMNHLLSLQFMETVKNRFVDSINFYTLPPTVSVQSAIISGISTNLSFVTSISPHLGLMELNFTLKWYYFIWLSKAKIKTYTLLVMFRNNNIKFLGNDYYSKKIPSNIFLAQTQAVLFSACLSLSLSLLYQVAWFCLRPHSHLFVKLYTTDFLFTKVYYPSTTPNVMHEDGW